jgi:hypothetical protein
VVEEPETTNQLYAKIAARLKLRPVDAATRTEILRDIYQELKDRPGERTTEELLDDLLESYEADTRKFSKTTLRQVWQMAFRQRAFDYRGRAISVHVPVWLARDIHDPETLIQRAESSFLYGIINSNLPIDLSALAELIYDDPDQTSKVEFLLEQLEKRHQIVRLGDEYHVLRPQLQEILDAPFLRPLLNDLIACDIPSEQLRGEESIQQIARQANSQRKKDFSAAAEKYLLACRLQWDLIETNEVEDLDEAVEELLYLMASYAASQAGALNVIEKDSSGSRQYYLAYFNLMRNEGKARERMEGLLDPMLTHFWNLAAAGTDVDSNEWYQRNNQPEDIAAAILTHPDRQVRSNWISLTRDLAKANPALVNRMSKTIQEKQSIEKVSEPG